MTVAGNPVAISTLTFPIPLRTWATFGTEHFRALAFSVWALTKSRCSEGDTTCICVSEFLPYIFCNFYPIWEEFGVGNA